MENIFVDLFLRLKRILHHFLFHLLFFKKSNALIFGSDIFAMNSSLKSYLSSPPNQHALFWQVWARRLLIIIAYETLTLRSAENEITLPFWSFPVPRMFYLRHSSLSRLRPKYMDELLS